MYFLHQKKISKGETSLDMTILFENKCIGNAHMDISYTGQQKHSVEFHGKNGSLILQNISNNFVIFNIIFWFYFYRRGSFDKSKRIL